MSIVDISNAIARQEDSSWNPATLSYSSVNPNSLAQKNNNPGNLRFVGQPGAVAGAGGFAKFDTIQDGYDALQAQVNLDASPARDLDLSSFIAKYAPPNENNTSAYLQNVMSWLGLTNPNVKLSSIIGDGPTTTDETTDVFGDDTETGSVNWALIAVMGVVGLGLWVSFK